MMGGESFGGRVGSLVNYDRASRPVVRSAGALRDRSSSEKGDKRKLSRVGDFHVGG